MLHSYVTDMAARLTPTIQIPNLVHFHLQPGTHLQILMATLDTGELVGQKIEALSIDDLR